MTQENQESAQVFKISNKETKRAGDEAKALLENKFFQDEVWTVLKAILQEKRLNCKITKEPELAQDLIRYEQILDEFETIVRSAIRRAEAIKQEELKLLKKQSALKRTFSRI